MDPGSCGRVSRPVQLIYSGLMLSCSRGAALLLLGSLYLIRALRY